MEWMSNLFEHYGYMVLFLGLFAESLALPFPGELAMAISGHMTALGGVNIPLVMIYSYVGAITGTIVTYYLGYKLGTPFFDKYGKFFFLNRERIVKLTKWFDQYGERIILISYFIPGLRHFTGYLSGILRVRFPIFLIYNSIGGLLWVMTYVMVGKVFGQQIGQILHTISQYSLGACALAIGIIVTILLIRKNRKKPSLLE